MIQSGKIPTRHLTPDEVLLAIRDHYIREFDIVPSDWDRRIKMDSPMSELYSFPGMDDFDFIMIYEVLLNDLGIGSIWEQQLEELGPEFRVCDLCIVLARHAHVPAAKPVSIFGSECLSAGAFRTVQQLLAVEGADVAKIAPSTPIAEYVYRYPKAFRTVGLMAPGHLPTLCARNPVFKALTVGLIYGSIGLLFLTGILIKPAPAIASDLAWIVGAFILFGFVLIPLVRHRYFWTVEVGNLHDFRDLIDAMLNRPLRPRRSAIA